MNFHWPGRQTPTGVDILPRPMLHPAFHLHNLFKIAAVFALLMTMSGCFDNKGRVEAHYKNGMKLLEEGEPEKASLEFRNALKLDQNAIEPRLEFAKLLLDQGNLQDAIGNYLKVVDLDPDNYEANVALGRVLLFADQLNDAAGRINAAYASYPADLQVLSLKAMYDLRIEQFESAEKLASQVLTDQPGQVAASLVMSEILVREGKVDQAIAVLDTALAETPTDLGLHLAKLLAIEQTGTMQDIGKQLTQMQRVFPQNQEITSNLVRWHLDQGDPTSAENLLRDLAAAYPNDLTHALSLVEYLQVIEGSDAAIEELRRMADATGNPVPYISVLAGLEFDADQQQSAIARLTAVLGTDLSDDETDEIQTQLAGMLFDSGDSEAAAILVTSILERDSTNSEALKLRALSAIDRDRPEEAISDLRTALEFAPQDPAILSLLAIAHERNGSPGLAQNRLALAVEASDAGVDESLSYARFLLRDGKPDVAAAVLVDALERRGEVPELLVGLARIQLLTGSWNAADQIASRIAALGPDKPYQQMASEIRVSSLTGQDLFDQSIGLLRKMWEDGGEDTSAMESLVRSLVLSGKSRDAASFLEGILAEDPRNARAGLLRGSVFVFEEKPNAAEEQYRKVVADHPDVEEGYIALSGFLTTQNRLDEADAVEIAGLDAIALPDRLMRSRVARLEQMGDIDGAIEIYERLYQADRLSDVTANNLVSHLASHRDDPDSLERAVQISKRLRGSPVPEFQDTYGWVLYRTGAYEQALSPLQTAAAALPDNQVVQIHYGMVLAKLEQNSRAVAQLQRALEMGDDPSNQTAVSRAKAELEGLLASANERDG